MYGGTRNQYKNTNEIVSESNNNAQILLSVDKKFEKKIHVKGISENGCNSTSRHDFVLKFSVNTQNQILFSEKNGQAFDLPRFFTISKKILEDNFYLPPIQSRVKKRLKHRYFPVNIKKFLRAAFL